MTGLGLEGDKAVSDFADYLKAISAELADWQGVLVALAFLFPFGLWLGSKRIESLKDSRLARYLSFTFGVLLLFGCQFTVWAHERNIRRELEELSKAPSKSVTPPPASAPLAVRPDREIRYVPIPSVQPSVPMAKVEQSSEQSSTAKREAVEGLLATARLIDTINQRQVGSDKHLTDIAEWQARANVVFRNFGDPDEIRRFNEIEPLEVPTPVGVSVEAGQRIARYKAQKVELSGYLSASAKR